MPHRLLSYPRDVFWALWLITPSAYAISLAMFFYYGRLSQSLIPIPSLAVAASPESYIYSGSAILVVPLMCVASRFVYKYFNGASKRIRRPRVISVGIATATAFGVLASICYGATALWTVQDGVELRLSFQAGLVLCLNISFIAFDVVMYKTRGGLPSRIWIHDIALLIFSTLYLGTGWFIVGRAGTKMLSMLAVCGYCVIMLAFGRYPMQCWQMLGRKAKAP